MMIVKRFAMGVGAGILATGLIPIIGVVMAILVTAGFMAGAFTLLDRH